VDLLVAVPFFLIFPRHHSSHAPSASSFPHCLASRRSRRLDINRIFHASRRDTPLQFSAFRVAAFGTFTSFVGLRTWLLRFAFSRLDLTCAVFTGRLHTSSATLRCLISRDSGLAPGFTVRTSLTTLRWFQFLDLAPPFWVYTLPSFGHLYASFWFPSGDSPHAFVYILHRVYRAPRCTFLITFYLTPKVGHGYAVHRSCICVHFRCLPYSAGYTSALVPATDAISLPLSGCPLLDCWVATRLLHTDHTFTHWTPLFTALQFSGSGFTFSGFHTTAYSLVSFACPPFFFVLIFTPSHLLPGQFSSFWFSLWFAFLILFTFPHTWNSFLEYHFTLLLLSALVLFYTVPGLHVGRWTFVCLNHATCAFCLTFTDVHAALIFAALFGPRAVVIFALRLHPATLITCWLHGRCSWFTRRFAASFLL